MSGEYFALLVHRHVSHFLHSNVFDPLTSVARSNVLAAMITIVLGAQWGDEGKGKLTDILCAKASLCARAQGGNNAGQ